jgi:hypothetical protein
MRLDPAWDAARAIPRTRKAARKAAFVQVRTQYGFTEYALHAYAKEARCTWIAEHIDSTMAQVLATRASSGSQSDLPGEGPCRALQESWPGPGQCRRQTQ